MTKLTGMKQNVTTPKPGGGADQVRDLDASKVKDTAAKEGAGQAPQVLTEPRNEAIDGGTAQDFVASETGEKSGLNAMNVRLGAASAQTLDDLIDATPWSDIYPAKDLMNDDEISSFLRGEMSPDDFRGFLEQARGPMDKDGLRGLYPQFDEVYASMSGDEQTRCDAGQMSSAEFGQLQDMMWERMDAAAEAFEAEGVLDKPDPAAVNVRQPEDKKVYSRGDIMTRVASGKGHNVTFGGQLMDRAVLGAMLDAIQGQGDGRVSQADVRGFMSKILDAGKITSAEENALLFGLKHCRFTKAADRELSQAIGDKFPNSAIAKFGGLGQPPRFKDYEQYDLPMFAGRSADLYGAKGVMDPAEFSAWSSGEMSLAQFNNVLQRANQPMSADDLNQTFGSWTANEATAAMTDAEFARFEGGKMSPAEFQNIQYRSWEVENPSLKGQTPYQEDFKAGFKPFVADDVQKPELRGLGAQMAELNKLLDAGDIDGMLALFPQDIVQTQLDLGVGKEQFLLEAFSIRRHASLDQVEEISLDTSRISDFGPDSHEIAGVAVLKNGDAVPANALLDGDYMLTSAVG